MSKTCSSCLYYGKSYKLSMNTLATRHYCSCEPTAMSEFIQTKNNSEFEPIIPSWTTTINGLRSPVEYMDCKRWKPTWELP